jgi:hypothetical protein
MYATTMQRLTCTTLIGAKPPSSCLRLYWRLSCSGRPNGVNLALTLFLILQITLPLEPTRPVSFYRQNVYTQDATCSTLSAFGVSTAWVLRTSVILIMRPVSVVWGTLKSYTNCFVFGACRVSVVLMEAYTLLHLGMPSSNMLFLRWPRSWAPPPALPFKAAT